MALSICESGMFSSRVNSLMSATSGHGGTFSEECSYRDIPMSNVGMVEFRPKTPKNRDAPTNQAGVRMAGKAGVTGWAVWHFCEAGLGNAKSPGNQRLSGLETHRLRC
jgi:hypothetical protein